MTFNHTVNSTDEDIASFVLSADFQFAILIWKYCPPLLLITGTFGNLMTLIVLSQLKDGNASMPFCFQALAISDLTLLYSGLLRNWMLYAFNFEIRNLHSIICRFHIWIVYVTGMTSSWFLVTMTCIRLLSVARPHRVNEFCTRRKLRATVGIVICTCCLLNAHILYGFATDKGGICNYKDEEYENFARGPWPWVDLMFTVLLPFVLIFIGNMTLVWNVATSVQILKHIDPAPSRAARATIHRKRASNALTLTLISVSSVYLILTSPICVYLIVDIYVKEWDSSLTSSSTLAWAVTNVLWYANSTANFYLYCMSGSRFRQGVLKFLCHLRFAGKERNVGMTRTPSKIPHRGQTHSISLGASASGCKANTHHAEMCVYM